MRLILILSYIFGGWSAQAGPPRDFSQIVFCTHQKLSQISDRPSCRFRWKGFDSESPVDLCLGDELYKKILLGRGIGSCTVWRGEWKEFSPPFNGEQGVTGKKHQFHFLAREYVGGDPSSGWIKRIELHRIELSHALAQMDPDGFFRQLILGESANQRASSFFRVLGFVHVYTASGMHLYALYLTVERILFFVFSLVRFPLGLSYFFIRVLPAISWLWVWCLSGLRRGMIRPWIMVGLQKLARLLGLKWRMGYPLIASVLIDFVLEMIIGRKIQLNYFHVLGSLHYILAVSGGLAGFHWAKKKNIFFEHFAMAIGSWLPIACIQALIEEPIALLTPLFSLLTIPLFVSILFPAYVLGLSDGWSMKIVLGANQILESLGALAVDGRSLLILLPRSLLVASVLSFLVLSLIYSIQLRIYKVVGLLVLLMLLSGVIHFQNAKNENSVKADRVIQFDVGQGDAAGVWSGSQYGMIDLGPSQSFNETQWLHLGLRLGFNHLDWIALTHLDVDHAGGWETLKNVFPVKCIVTSKNVWTSARGIQIRGDDLLRTPQFEVSEDLNQRCFPYFIFPPRGNFSASVHTRQANAFMSSYLVPLKNGDFYFNSGDSDSNSELRAAHWARNISQAPFVLKVSHHGSRFSTSDLFLKILQPKEAWISDGVNNRYGHPSVQAVSNLMKEKIPVKRTDEQGWILEE